jgi:hypothetical protein
MAFGRLFPIDAINGHGINRTSSNTTQSEYFRRRRHHCDVGCDDRNGPSVMPGFAISTARLRGADTARPDLRERRSSRMVAAAAEDPPDHHVADRRLLIQW